MTKIEVMYCEVCGENPYYISVYDESGQNNEVLVCKNCYMESD